MYDLYDLNHVVIFPSSQNWTHISDCYLWLVNVEEFTLLLGECKFKSWWCHSCLGPGAKRANLSVLWGWEGLARAQDQNCNQGWNLLQFSDVVAYQPQGLACCVFWHAFTLTTVVKNGYLSYHPFPVSLTQSGLSPLTSHSQRAATFIYLFYLNIFFL